jgi:hypothetical protein
MTTLRIPKFWIPELHKILKKVTVGETIYICNHVRTWCISCTYLSENDKLGVPCDCFEFEILGSGEVSKEDKIVEIAEPVIFPETPKKVSKETTGKTEIA